MDKIYNDFLIDKIKILKNSIKELEHYLKWFRWTNMDLKQEKQELEHNNKLLFLYEYEFKNWFKFIF